jgi:hypothetical protein
MGLEGRKVVPPGGVRKNHGCVEEYTEVMTDCQIKRRTNSPPLAHMKRGGDDSKFDKRHDLRRRDIVIHAEEIFRIIPCLDRRKAIPG